MTSASVEMSSMQDYRAWENWNRLREFLAHQLCGGRLALVLGAGLLHGFGLPDWDELTTRIFALKAATRPTGVDNEMAADTFLIDQCREDDLEFARLVRQALYDGVDLSMDALRRRDILAAIGSLMMSSSRGSVSRVITLNFDDLLERYLTYYGFLIESVSNVPAWGSRVDARVFHWHGLLPSSRESELPGPIVMAQKHYDRSVGKEHNAWHATVIDIMRANTCVFIGLSGRDKNLLSVLTDVQATHPSRSTKDAFWGVRFATADDPLKTNWRGRGVYQFDLASYGELSSRLFDVCQFASELWRGKLTQVVVP
jgi:hypothetical protein